MKMKFILSMIMSAFILTGLFAQEKSEHCADCAINCKTQSFVAVQRILINSIGEFGKDWKEAHGIYLTYGIIYANNWSLIFQTGFMNFKPNDNVEYFGDPSFTVIPLAVGTRYYIINERFRPFLLANGGLNIVSQNYANADTTMGQTTNQMHFQVGAGLGIIIYEGLEIEFQAKYNSHLLEPSVPYNITGVEYGVAINWNFF